MERKVCTDCVACIDCMTCIFCLACIICIDCIDCTECIDCMVDDRTARTTTQNEPGKTGNNDPVGKWVVTR